MAKLTILCSLCGHDRLAHKTILSPARAVVFYCQPTCPCHGSDTFKGKATL